MTLPDPNAPPMPVDPAEDPKKKQADQWSQQFWAGYDGKYQQGYQFPQSDPAQDFIGKFNQNQSNKPDPNAQVIPDQEWDYKTATTDKNGQPLPFGAVGWDPNGGAYYGQGITGWLNGAVSRITDPGAKQAKFDFTKPNTDLATTVGNVANNVEQAGNLTDSFGVDSPLTPVLRGLKEVVGGAFGLLALPAQLTERVGGTIGMAVGGVDVPTAWEASRITYSTWFDQSKREQMIQGVKDGQNPELLAMQLENPTAEFWGQLILDPTWVLGMVNKGEKAASLLETTAAKLTQSGAVESVEVGKIVDSLSAIGKGLDEAQATGKLIDEATANGHLQQVADAVTTAVQTVKDGVGSYKPGFFARLTASQQAIYADVTGRHADWLVNTMQNLGENPEEIGQALYHTAMLASEDAGERNVALSYVLKHHPVPKMALSEPGLQTANTLWHSIGGNADKFFEDLAAAQKLGTDAVVEFGNKRMANAAKDMFPSVTEMRNASEALAKGTAETKKLRTLAAQYKTMSPGVKAAEQFASSMLPTQYRKIVGTMTGVYLSSPGYVARNIINNAFTGFVDQGGKFFAAKGQVFVTDLFGATHFAEKDLAEMAGQAFRSGGLGKAGDAVDEAFSLSKIIPKWADGTERGAGSMVMRASMQDSLTKLLQPGKFLPDTGKLIEAGMTPQQATMFTRAILDANGDVDKAILRFRGTAAATGTTAAWKDTSQLFPHVMTDFLGKIEVPGANKSLLEVVQDALHNTAYTNVEDAVKAIPGTIRDTLAKIAEGTVNDTIAISEKHPGATNAADWMHASETGLLDVGKGAQLTALKQAGRNFETQAKNTLRMIGTLGDGGADNIKYTEGVIADIEKVASDTAAAADKITKETWDISNRVKAGFKPTSEGWSQILGRPVKDGEATQDLLNELWDNKFKKVSETWNSYYVGAKQRFGSAYTDLSVSISLPDHQVKADAAFKNGEDLFAHYQEVQQAWSDGKNLFSGAKPGAVNEALTTAEMGAQAAKNASPVEAAIKQAVDGGLNEFQIQNHFKKTGEPITPEAIAEYAKSKGIELAAPEAQKVRVPYAGNRPSSARVAYESARGIEPELQRMEKFIRDNWGQSLGTFGDDLDGALANYANEAKPLIAQARKVGMDVAKGARDFSFLDYNDKRGFDAVANYITPLSYWPSRTYGTWLQRVYTDPGVLAGYAKYKDYMAKIHADMPEFYKYQVNSNELLGMHNDNPLFFNLEATLWPLNGLTGVDFNDPYKRTDWWSALLDDMGKVGPGAATPITMATAIAQYMRGEKDAAARTAGRLFPVTAQIKAGLTMANITLPDTPFTHGNELDPNVNFFGKDGSDPYEQRRIGGSALQRMVDDGVITQEQALDAADQASGPIWEEAKRRATLDRAGPTLASWGLGVGWKGRTTTDVKIDKFYQEYIALSSRINGGQVSPEDTRKEFDDLRTKYPFMDLVILSKKDGPDRDRAYAYNTLGRLPPGQSGQIATAAGISADLIQKFYDDKGNMATWAPSDKDKFMAGVSDMAAVFAAPDSATQQSWSAARTAYNDLKTKLQAQFGADIQDKQDAFYNIGTETQRQRDLQNDYLNLHPEVKNSFDLRTQLIAQTPELTQYYGGLAAIEKYESLKMFADIKSKLGNDVFQKFDQYGSLKFTDPNAAKAYYRQNNLDQYAKIKAVWQDKINQSMARVGAMFVPGAPAQLRQGIPATTGTTAIQATVQQQNAPQKTWQDWSTIMSSEPLQRMVLDYFNTGKKVPSSGSYYLEKIAKDYGYPNTDALLQAMGSSLFQAQGQP